MMYMSAHTRPGRDLPRPQVILHCLEHACDKIEMGWDLTLRGRRNIDSRTFMLPR
jgi:hypothetical protein